MLFSNLNIERYEILNTEFENIEFIFRVIMSLIFARIVPVFASYLRALISSSPLNLKCPGLENEL